MSRSVAFHRQDPELIESFEKFTYPNRERSRPQERSTRRERQQRAAESTLTDARAQIIVAVRKYGAGFVTGATIGEAIRTIVSWTRLAVRLVRSAFEQLHRAEAFLYSPNDRGFRLNVVA